MRGQGWLCKQIERGGGSPPPCGYIENIAARMREGFLPRAHLLEAIGGEV